MGGYERIYPPAFGTDNADKQPKYNEIIKAVYNFEAELQIRRLQRDYDNSVNARKQNIAAKS